MRVKREMADRQGTGEEHVNKIVIKAKEQRTKLSFKRWENIWLL